MRLIDADALMELLKAWQYEAQRIGAEINNRFATAIIAQVNAMPTIEPEQKKGKKMRYEYRELCTALAIGGKQIFEMPIDSEWMIGQVGFEEGKRAEDIDEVVVTLVKKKRFEDLLCETKSSWTLVSDELPDKYTTVIVSCIDDSGDTPFSYTACGYWVGLLPDDDPAWIVDGEVNYHVVAWMPLPEPWEEGADE